MLGVALEPRVGELVLPLAARAVAAANPPEEGLRYFPLLLDHSDALVVFTATLSRRAGAGWGLERPGPAALSTG